MRLLQKMYNTANPTVSKVDPAMITSFSPSLTPTNDESSDWYRNFHNSFWMCQITNNLLVSYIEMDDHSGKESFDLISYRIEEIRARLLGRNSQVRHMASIAGYEIEIEENIEIEIDKLKDLSSELRWGEIIKGFLNLWEFLFLFSSFESALKSALACPRLRGAELIQTIRGRLGEVCSVTPIEQIENSLWPYYSEVRNIFAHSHGIVTAKDLDPLKKKIDLAREFAEEPSAGLNEDANDFDDKYGDYLISRVIQMPIFDDETFNKSNAVESKFYFLKDQELNIFRNIITDIIAGVEERIS